jgi:hypothetical protein
MHAIGCGPYTYRRGPLEVPMKGRYHAARPELGPTVFRNPSICFHDLKGILLRFAQFR